MPTSAGSAALKHSMPPLNAAALQKLLDQGAILIGKANMSELASSYADDLAAIAPCVVA